MNKSTPQTFADLSSLPSQIGRPNRRRFLQNTSLAAAAAVPYFATATRTVAQSQGASERLRMGCIGVGSMGTGDAVGHTEFADILAVCDVDAERRDKARMDERIGKGKADAYEDYRRILERDDIDVVSIVTPDHWHVKIAIEALQAGKHVFCQKPLTLTLEENALVRNACKQHPDRVFFIGTQQRSSRDRFLRAVNMVQKGLLGDIQRVTVGINGGDVGGPFEKTRAPATLNWDKWLGQAPKVDYIPERCHYQFRWWYEYSGGKFTDWGAHHVDIAMWALGLQDEGDGPVEIDGRDAAHPVPYTDGYPNLDNCYNTSQNFAINCRFENGVEMVVTSRGDNGILFEGTKGRLFVNRGRINGKPIDENWDEGKFGSDDINALYKGKPFDHHKANFYRCIREGGLPVSDVYSHLQAMSVCHLCAIAARLQRVIRWDPATEKILEDELAASFVARKPRAGFEIPRV